MGNLTSYMAKKVNLQMMAPVRPKNFRQPVVDTIWGKSEGLIYFIGASEQAEAPRWIKVGFTAGDPRARLRAMQTGCPLELVLIASIPGPMKAETEMHEVFADERVRGEWFRASEFVLNTIENLVVGVYG